MNAHGFYFKSDEKIDALLKLLDIAIVPDGNDEKAVRISCGNCVKYHKDDCSLKDTPTECGEWEYRE